MPNTGKKKIKPSILNISHVTSTTWDKIESRGKAPEIPLKSLPEINEMLWGLQKKKMYIIGARTSQGKTSFVLQLLLDALLDGKKIMYLSFEMSAEDIIERLFCNYCSVNNYDLFTGKHAEYKKLFEEFKEKLEGTIFIYTLNLGWSWDDIVDFFKDLGGVHPDILVIDYIQAISQGAQKGKEFIDDYIVKFRQYAIENNFCGILISQLNRANTEGKDKRPQMQHLKGSGYLEELADVVILLDWIHKNSGGTDERSFTVNIAKNRSGRTGYINLHFIPEYYKFITKPIGNETPKESYYEAKEMEWEL